MPGAYSRNKGARLEREFAALLRQYGMEARRNLSQYQKEDGRDLCSSVPLCIQVKGGASPSPWAAYREALEAAATGEVAMAAVHRDREQWMLFVKADDVLPMVAYWYSLLGPGGQAHG